MARRQKAFSASMHLHVRLEFGLPRLSKPPSAADSEIFDRAVQTNNYSHLISLEL